MLLPVLDWALRQNCQSGTFESSWADLGRLPRPPKSLVEKIRVSIDLYDPDLIFIHRDAEKVPLNERRIEILTALNGIETPAVSVIPVRMQESWLLLNEEAIRIAAGNPGGRMELGIPPINRVETLPDPKALLFDLLRTASGLTGVRLKKLNVRKICHTITNSAEDFSQLRALSAFKEFETNLRNLVHLHGWG